VSSKYAAAFLLAAAPLVGQQHSFSPTDVEMGARLYQAHCLACHGAEGNLIPGTDFRQGKLRRGSSDDDLVRAISTGIPGTAMPPTNFITPELWAVISYLRSMGELQSGPTAAGDPRRGQALFEGKGACLTCHRVNGKGSRVGPDLSDVGAIRSAGHLQRSLVAPNEFVLMQHRVVRAVTRDGTVITGRRLNEDTHTVQIIDGNERLISLSKAELRECTVLQESTMPSYPGKLSAQELADLVNYMVTLKGSQTQ
jgi:cytochrome c oxidase cbb3-type subunit 3